MKMKKISLFFAAAVLAAVVLTGCKSGLHEGGSYVRGESEGFNFCGFMTFVPVSYTDAFTELQKNADIKDKNKYILTKYYVEPSSKYFVVFSLPKLNVEAEKTDLAKNDVKVLKSNAVGIDKGFKFLGFMDFYPARYTNALSDLYAKSGVAGERGVTVTEAFVEYSAMYFILFSITETKVTADVVSVTEKGSAASAPVTASVKAPAPVAKAVDTTK
jgi:hypothetical protein